MRRRPLADPFERAYLTAMLMVLSPAKRLDFTPPAGALADLATTRPVLAAETAILSKTTRGLSRAKLSTLMGISRDLADLNHARFQAFDPASEGGLAAAFAFAGDVYEGLKARGMSAGDLAFAQDHLRILSGLYGLLRPLDAIQPYRLEMGTRLKTRRGGSLYDFWGDRVSKALNVAVEGQADPTLVNLASQEYFGAVDARALKPPVVTLHFREEKDGQSRVISFFAKKARGAMARYAVVNRIDRAEGLRGFDLDGYRFDRSASGEVDWLFTRPQPAAVNPRPKVAEAA